MRQAAKKGVAAATAANDNEMKLDVNQHWLVFRRRTEFLWYSRVGKPLRYKEAERAQPCAVPDLRRCFAREPA